MSTWRCMCGESNDTAVDGSWCGWCHRPLEDCIAVEPLADRSDAFAPAPAPVDSWSTLLSRQVARLTTQYAMTARVDDLPRVTWSSAAVARRVTPTERTRVRVRVAA